MQTSLLGISFFGSSFDSSLFLPSFLSSYDFRTSARLSVRPPCQFFFCPLEAIRSSVRIPFVLPSVRPTVRPSVPAFHSQLFLSISICISFFSLSKTAAVVCIGYRYVTLLERIKRRPTHVSSSSFLSFPPSSSYTYKPA